MATLNNIIQSHLKKNILRDTYALQKNIKLGDLISRWFKSGKEEIMGFNKFVIDFICKKVYAVD